MYLFSKYDINHYFNYNVDINVKNNNEYVFYVTESSPILMDPSFYKKHKDKYIKYISYIIKKYKLKNLNAKHIYEVESLINVHRKTERSENINEDINVFSKSECKVLFPSLSDYIYNFHPCQTKKGIIVENFEYVMYLEKVLFSPENFQLLNNVLIFYLHHYFESLQPKETLYDRDLQFTSVIPFHKKHQRKSGYTYSSSIISHFYLPLFRKNM